MTDRLEGHGIPRNIADEDAFHLAKRYHTLLEERVAIFKERIGEQEVGMRLLGELQEPFYLQEIHHADPSLISLSGVTTDGRPIDIIQDVSNINIILLPLPKRDL